MFVLTTLVYPVLLALLCVGAGLLIDRMSGGFLPALLLPVVGAAALIAVSQLSTYVAPAAPATPYLMAAFAIAGFALARARAWTLLRRAPSSGSAYLYGIFLTPAGSGSPITPRVVGPDRWPSLCGRPYEWIEVVPA
jgi:hypothetical protein